MGDDPHAPGIDEDVVREHDISPRGVGEARRPEVARNLIVAPARVGDGHVLENAIVHRNTAVPTEQAEHTRV